MSTSLEECLSVAPKVTDRTTVAGTAAGRRRVGLRAEYLSVFVAVALLAMLLQWRAGALEAPFGTFSDESAHYVTGLMLHDFLSSRQSPLSAISYAERYYAHYPNVAIGHWPPLLYIAEALWGFVAGTTRTSFLLLNSLFTAAIAVVIYSASCRYRRALAAVGALAFPLLPPVRYSLMWVGADLATTLAVLLATYEFGRFLDENKRRSALCFGLLAATAILTKGNGWLLALVPIFAAILLRRRRLLTDRWLWLSALIVLAICLPWQILTLKMVESGFQHSLGATFSIEAIKSYAHAFFDELGPAFILLLAVGSALGLWRYHRVSTANATWISLALSVIAFHIIVPASIDTRFLLAAFAALLVLAAAAASKVVDQFPKLGPAGPRAAAPVLLAVSLGQSLFLGAHAIRWEGAGVADASAAISSDPTLRGAALMISSAKNRDVAFVADLAMRDPQRPSWRVVRAVRVLAYSDWNGTTYKLLVKTERALDSLLKSVPVSAIVLDGVSNDGAMPHHELLTRLLLEKPGEWRLQGRYPAGETDAARQVRVFRYVGPPPTRMVPLEIEVKGRRIRL